MMNLFVYIFAFLATSCQAYDELQLNQPDVLRTDRGNEANGQVHASLWKRSIQTELGKAAVNLLLEGTMKAKSEVKSFKKYVKKGNWNTAFKDFLSVHPRTVTRENHVYGGVIYRGKIGDHKISLTTNDRMGRRIPSISIENTKGGEVPKKIFYRKKINKEFYEP